MSTFYRDIFFTFFNVQFFNEGNGWLYIFVFVFQQCFLLFEWAALLLFVFLYELYCLDMIYNWIGGINWVVLLYRFICIFLYSQFFFRGNMFWLSCFAQMSSCIYLSIQFQMRKKVYVVISCKSSWEIYTDATASDLCLISVMNRQGESKCQLCYNQNTYSQDGRLDRSTRVKALDKWRRNDRS